MDIAIRFKAICQEYIDLFAEKHDIEFGYWVGEDFGGVAMFDNDNYFSLEEMRLDINYDIPGPIIWEWVRRGRSVSYRTFLQIRGFLKSNKMGRDATRPKQLEFNF